jgi:hypothetical protein
VYNSIPEDGQTAEAKAGSIHMDSFKSLPGLWYPPALKPQANLTSLKKNNY